MNATKLKFGDFELDVAGYELSRRGRSIKLERIPMELLLLLLDRRGQLVTRDEVLEKLWGKDVFLDVDNSINTAVSKIRVALKDDPEDPAFIKTISGKGYRFIAPITALPEGKDALTQSAVQEHSSDGLGKEANSGLGQINPERTDGVGRTLSRFIAPISWDGSSRVEPAESRSAEKIFTWKIAAAAVVVAIAAISTGWLWRSKQVRPTEKDTIVLADFTNTTGDPVFDDALKQALAAGLQQSPFLNILSDQRIRETLSLMGHSPHDRLNEEAAKDLCQRVGSKAVLSGSIASLGSHYAIGLNATNCVTGDSLDREEVEAARKEDVLNALDRASMQLRRKLGESLSSIQRFDTPMDQVTTPSLEALKAWSAAIIIRSEKGDAAAIPMLRRTIELDPNFAMAHALLGTVYSNLEEPSLAEESMKKAYDLRDRVSEWERFYIESHYHHFATGELEKGNQVYQLWAQTYPQEGSALANLGMSHASLGQHGMAIAEILEALRREPDNEFAHTDLLYLYADLNRLDDARAAYQQAMARKIDNMWLHVGMYGVASVQGDAAEMGRQLAWAAGKPEIEDVFLSEQAETEGFYGRLANARAFSRRAVESAQRAEKKQAAALWQMNAALREAAFGNLDRARQETAAALALAATRDTQTLGALVLAQAGDAVQAQRITEDLAKRFPLDTLVNGYWVPTIRAAISLNRNNPAKAVELLHGAESYELGAGLATAEFAAPLHPTFVRGQGYLLLHEGKLAAAEYQKFVDHRGLVRNCTPGAALAYLGLARAYALQHDTAKARAAYQDFLALWKDADPDIPVLKVANAEYAKLK
jgi:DNA-binding winged helix-turn-helix (wHTH) protein/tetratricopeptide (TPR) repeat protein